MLPPVGRGRIELPLTAYKAVALTVELPAQVCEFAQHFGYLSSPLLEWLTPSIILYKIMSVKHTIKTTSQM